MEIEDIKKISLDEGDVLAIQLPENTSSDQLQKFIEYMTAAFPNNKCIAYTDKIEFQKITGGK